MCERARLDAWLNAKRTIILDGGLATELEAAGYDLSGELWSAAVLAHNPEAIEAVHRAYLEAGADVITSASYQASQQGFDHAGIADVDKHLSNSVLLARRVRDEYERAHPGRDVPALVAASVGPLGAVYHDGSEFTGLYGSTLAARSDAPVVPPTAELRPGRQSLSTLMDFHRPRLRSLLEAAPDVLACETIPCLLEAEALCRLLAQEFSSARAWISFSCIAEGRLVTGEALADAVQIIESIAPNQVVAIGVNCTHPCYIVDCIRAIVDAPPTDKPKGTEAALPPPRRCLVYPNVGKVWDFATRKFHDHHAASDCALSGLTVQHTLTQEQYVQMARQWRDAGAFAVGGCCHTTPAIIRAMKMALVQ